MDEYDFRVVKSGCVGSKRSESDSYILYIYILYIYIYILYVGSCFWPSFLHHPPPGDSRTRVTVSHCSFRGTLLGLEFDRLEADSGPSWSNRCRRAPRQHPKGSQLTSVDQVDQFADFFHSAQEVSFDVCWLSPADGLM